MCQQLIVSEMEGSNSRVLHVENKNNTETGEKRRKKGSGYKLDVQKKLRISGKEYTTSRNVKKPGKKPPVPEVRFIT